MVSPSDRVPQSRRGLGPPPLACHRNDGRAWRESTGLRKSFLVQSVGRKSATHRRGARSSRISGKNSAIRARLRTHADLQNATLQVADRRRRFHADSSPSRGGEPIRRIDERRAGITQISAAAANRAYAISAYPREKQ
jgi:hypothetical protein